MKFLFDLGTNLGQGLSEINSELNALGNKDFKVYSFEANPNIIIDLKYDNFTYINKAVSDENGKCKLKVATRVQDYNKEKFKKDLQKNIEYVGIDSKKDSFTSVGCYVIDKNILGQLGGSGHHNVVVDKIDIVEFIRETTEKDDSCEIYIKMDIEGSEFCILRKLLKYENILKKIKKMWIETHERFVKNENADTVKELFNSLKINDIDVVHWK